MPATETRATTSPDDARTSAKDRAVTGTILAAAGLAWFGWGHVGERFVPLLEIGMAVGAALVVWGVVLVRTTPGQTTMSADTGVRRTYWTAMWAQVVAISVGALALGNTGHPSHLPAWVLGVVGLHFLPLARVFGARVLAAAGWACVAVAVLAVAVGVVGWLPAPTVAGGGGGLVLVTSALVALGSLPVVRRG